MKLFAAIMITPSEIIHDISASPPFWTQVLWVDPTVFGGVMGGSWNIAIRCKCRLGNIRQNPRWVHVGNLCDVYYRMGPTIGEENEGVKRSMPLANSCARIASAEVPGEKVRLSGESQVAPFTLKKLREKWYPNGRRILVDRWISATGRKSYSWAVTPSGPRKNGRIHRKPWTHCGGHTKLHWFVFF